LQSKVQGYLTSTQTTLDQQKEFDSFLSILSPSLRLEVTKHIFIESIMSNPVFEENEGIIDSILHDLDTLLYFPEDEICTQGSVGDKLYFLSRGDWEVHIMDQHKSNKLIRTLKPGSCFGEVSLLKNCPRTATVISKNYSTCAGVQKDKFEKLLVRFPFVKKNMEANIKKNYNDKWRQFVQKSLRTIDYLHNSENISDNIIQELSYKLETISLSKDEYLFKSGKAWTEIFIIVSGIIEVSIKNQHNSSSSYLDTLYSGCTIGSYGALMNEYYSISGKAVEECTILKLKSSKLEEFRDTYDELDLEILDYENYTEENGLPYWDYKLSRKNLNITPIGNTTTECYYW